MFCSKCGAKAFESGQFCPECGNTLHLVTPASSAASIDSSSAANEDLATSSVKKSKTSKQNAIILASVIGGIALIGVVAVNLNGAQQFQQAISSCNASGGDTLNGAELSSDGKSLYLDGSGEEDYLGMSSSKQFCVLDALGMPAMVKTRMLETNSLMGVQEAEWDGITAKWTYHPNNGMDVSIEK